ncbi:MAG: Protein-N(5)-glutamine methyltransferase PrmC, methylates polypeptide chain release factors RF1 and RF2 [uncultured Sulfurovum sp.]|uniref:peptide chain release factor N(5)-glutamine methyltransferase n=1 Tax=uncultured Sulfurovum sp. TaxID=269237 RepID=A0A6S6U7C0_9BACT|nr:MAG: Protein-N(5)-glutamine methyltransferase PrmC, methylates polypeptide chain release factors RF1 and RF2 [uncultured Sulfurovum sp.]
MNINETLKWASKQLVESCERPTFEAELLLAYHLKKDRTYLHAFDNNEVIQPEAFKRLVSRRATHEPYEYIVGEASFYDIELNVEAGVLIPRPETEILIDLVAEIIEKENITHIAEVGVGSGAISVVLARKFSKLTIIATDICDTPIKVATSNFKKYALDDRVEIRKSNILDEVNEALELVVSNPPYIADDFELEKNVADYEPKEALFGGSVGDELLKQIVLDVKERNIKYLACEMGYDQKEPMTQFFNKVGVKSYKFYKDLAGFDRGFVVEFT